MSILNYNDWQINEQNVASGAVKNVGSNSTKDDPKNNVYTLSNRASFVYRISSDNKWQYQKVDTDRKEIWHWVTNNTSVKALNSKYNKDLKVHVDIESKAITDSDKLKIVETIKQTGKSLGWTDNAIAAFVGNIGRENNFNWKYIAGSHTDPKNKVTNFGIISWQGSRLDGVKKALKDAGLLQENGSAKRSQSSISTMVKFADSEMNSQGGDSSIMRKAGASTKEISDMLYKYIRYSKGSPYNTPDPKFNVTKNHYWAAAAKLAGAINYV